jgi:hypothetical protein
MCGVMRALLALLLLAALPAAAQTPAAPPEPFRVVNGTGQEARELYAVRSGRPDWGRSLIERPLAAAASFALRPSAAAGCRFDLRLVLADGREAVRRDNDICATREVALGAADVAAARPAPPSSARPDPQARGVATGTGFVVAADRVLTNHHVIDGCTRILVRTPDDRTLAATPPARVDEPLDLALLTVPGNPGPPIAFRNAPTVRQGESVIAYGFPLAGLLASSPTLTRGEINNLAGLGNNPAQYQISAPVQPGNSGGPLLDMQGNIVGVIVSKLNAQRVAQRTGDLAQNVNFAIKGERALEFLRRAGVEPRLAESRGADRSAADVGDVARRSTVFIRCER